MFQLTSQFSVKREGFLFIDAPTWLPEQGWKKGFKRQFCSSADPHLSRIWVAFFFGTYIKEEKSWPSWSFGLKVKSKCLPPAQLNGTWTPVVYQTKEPNWACSEPESESLRISPARQLRATATQSLQVEAEPGRVAGHLPH